EAVLPVRPGDHVAVGRVLVHEHLVTASEHLLRVRRLLDVPLMAGFAAAVLPDLPLHGADGDLGQHPAAEVRRRLGDANTVAGALGLHPPDEPVDGRQRLPVGTLGGEALAYADDVAAGIEGDLADLYKLVPPRDPV